MIADKLLRVTPFGLFGKACQIWVLAGFEASWFVLPVRVAGIGFFGDYVLD
jgi:hypothetical protein